MCFEVVKSFWLVSLDDSSAPQNEIEILLIITAYFLEFSMIDRGINEARH